MAARSVDRPPRPARRSHGADHRNDRRVGSGRVRVGRRSAHPDRRTLPDGCSSLPRRGLRRSRPFGTSRTRRTRPSPHLDTFGVGHSTTPRARPRRRRRHRPSIIPRRVAARCRIARGDRDGHATVAATARRQVDRTTTRKPELGADRVRDHRLRRTQRLPATSRCPPRRTSRRRRPPPRRGRTRLVGSPRCQPRHGQHRH